MKKTVVFGISGGIAAYKILELIPLLKREGIDVIVMMTYGASKMVSPKACEKVTGNPVYFDMFSEAIDYQHVVASRKVDHIELAKKADVIVVAPATANCIAKIAHGFADDYVSTTVLAARSPVLICPSMNTVMWKNPLTQKNMERVRAAGYAVLNPEAGLLACGDTGDGKLVSLAVLKEEIIRLLSQSQKLQGKKILVTAGGTQESIDSVRFITNKSSGKMGAAIAEAAYLRGAEVLLLRSKQAQSARYPVQEKTFETTEELELLLQDAVSRYDFCFHAAAVSDFSVKEQCSGKLASEKEVMITLLPREKILAKIKKINKTIHLIAFKAEWDVSEESLLLAAKKTLRESYADVIIANDVGRKNQGFAVDTNEVYVIMKNGKTKKISLAAKTVIAEKILDSLYIYS